MVALLCLPQSPLLLLLSRQWSLPCLLLLLPPSHQPLTQWLLPLLLCLRPPSLLLISSVLLPPLLVLLVPQCLLLGHLCPPRRRPLTSSAEGLRIWGKRPVVLLCSVPRCLPPKLLLLPEKCSLPSPQILNLNQTLVTSSEARERKWSSLLSLLPLLLLLSVSSEWISPVRSSQEDPPPLRTMLVGLWMWT